MTHDELLAKIDSELVTHGQRGNIVKHSFALRAVVELHKPHIFTDNDGYKWFYCTICKDGFAPCTTIQAIEKELK